MQMINRFLDLDLSLLALVLSQRSRPALTPIAKTVSHSGDGYLQVLCIGIGFAAASPLANEFAMTMCKLFVIERIVYFFLKNSLKRKRPANATVTVAALVTASDEFSFPSGHTSAAFLLAITATAYFPIAGLVLLPWATCVGLSRVYLGVHYPSDIIAGLILATSLFYFI